MISIKSFVFNSFQTNTYILSDDTRECLIIDAACEDDYEKSILSGFIESNKLHPARLIYTHCHIDHTLGNTYVSEKYGLEPEVHQDGKLFWETAREFSSVFNVNYDKPMYPKKFLKDGDLIAFGTSSLQVLYTPGHADGSICLWNREQKFVIVGDVLFYGSIGRTDLPTGDYDKLMKSLWDKLFSLADETVVYPGHGPATTIGFEKINNPFINF
jgi:glyoxylase-like metal-dependent hydrolase (beta-lactamase superfamily II)